MDSPIRKSAASILGRSKVAVSTINAKFTSLKLPPAAIPQQSVGSLLAMAITAGKTHSADSIINEAAQIRRTAKMTMAECEKQLSELKSASDLWFQLSDFLTSKQAVLPPTVPAYIARAATLVRAAALSGSLPASTLQTLAEEIKRNAMTSLSFLAETEKRLARVKSAGGVACALQTDSFISRIKSHAGFTKKDRARLEKYSPIVHRIAVERRKAHAEVHFTEHQIRHTYKNYEQTATGVQL